MSVIAWDGETLAADRQATKGTMARTTTKIFKYDQRLFALIGGYTDSTAVMNWILQGHKAEDFPKLLNPDEPGVVWLITPNGVACYEGSPFPVIIHDRVLADGTGGKIALGAMLMGADAVKAVEIATQHDIYCGGGVDALRLA